MLCLTEYNEAETMEMFREEGIEEEKVNGIRRAMNKQKLELEEAMEYMDIPVAERPRYTLLMKKYDATSVYKP